MKSSERAGLQRTRYRFALANWALVAVFLLALWTPLWWRQRVSTPPVADSDVENWRAPEPSVDAALWQLALDWDVWEIQRTNILEQADEILDGRLRLAGRPPVRMDEINWWSDPFHDSTWRLQFQGLRHARILLTAWHMTGRPIYLSRAQDVILSWIGFAKKWPFGGGYMWSDQAIGDRAVVFSAFWAAYKRSPAHDSAIAAEVLRSTAQQVGLLVDSGHFTFQTSHGILQNVSLLHVAGTLPELAERANAIDVAVQRLTLQYRMLATPEGVWTEHSPGYHLLAVNLLRSASAYLTILRRPIPAEWVATQERLERTLVQMSRPDGSLPPLGDTIELPKSGHAWPPELAAAVKVRKRSKQLLAPCGGYAVLWDDRPAIERQVVMTVSNFRGHSHKHADELSTYLFGDGITWLTGPGYWPYADPERQYATGWTSANAPAHDGEPEMSDRQASLLAYGHGEWGEFVEMERSGPAGFRARRRVAWVHPDWLIVTDRVSTRGRHIVVRWLLSPDLVVDGRTNEGWTAHLRRGPLEQRLRIWVLSDPPAAVNLSAGSARPFRGWVFTGDKVRAAPAFEIKPAGENALVASVFHLESGISSKAVKPRLERSGDKWSISVNGVFELSSAADQAAIEDLRCPPAVKLARRNLEAVLASQYGAPSASVPLTRYRDVTLLVIVVWLFQEVSLIVIKRWSQRLVIVIRLGSCLCLIAAAVFFAIRWYGTYVI